MKQKAFTLIELLLVISIISLLSSIILSNLKEAREKAEDQEAYSAAKELVNAVELYRADHDGEYPHTNYTSTIIVSNYTYSASSGISLAKSPNNFDIFMILQNYIKFDINSVPSSITKGDRGRFGYLTSGTSTYYKCSDREEIPKYIIAFVTNNTNFLNLPHVQTKSSTGSSWNKLSYILDQQKAICVY